LCAQPPGDLHARSNATDDVLPTSIEHFWTYRCVASRHDHGLWWRCHTDLVLIVGADETRKFAGRRHVGADYGQPYAGIKYRHPHPSKWRRARACGRCGVIRD
jgi:hypothetical protein